MAGMMKYATSVVAASALVLVLTGMAAAIPGMPYPQKDGDITRGEVKRFDHYLDQHPEVTEQLRKHPGLVNNQDYMEKHPELREFMKNHPEVREELKSNPRAFMKRENRYDRHENSKPRPLPAARVGGKH